MQLFLYRDTKDEIVHASINQKVTGCRIKLKNAAQFTQAGTEDFSELMDFLDRVNCQKCQDYFTPKILKADAKAMKQKLKAEKKGISYENSAPAPSPEPERYRPSAAPAPTPVQQTPPPPPVPAPAPAPAPVEQNPEPPAYQAPDLDDSALPQYEEWTPPTAKKKEPAPSAPAANNLDVDDSLAQFMLGKQEDPTAAAFASDNSPNPNALASQQIPDNTAGLLDNTLAQFAIPGTNPAPMSAPAAPSVPEQASALMDDMLAQFAVPGTNTTLSGMQSLDAPVQTPVQQTTPKITGIDDILAEFGQKPSEKEEETLDELFAKFKEEKKQNAPQSQFQPQPQLQEQPQLQMPSGMPGMADLSDFGNLEVPQLNGMNYSAPAAAPVVNPAINPAVTPAPAPAVSPAAAKPAPVVNKSAASALMGELDEISMAPKVENKEEEEDDYMSLVVNTRLEDYDDDDDDVDDYDDYYDDDEEEYHGSSYAPSDDSDDVDIDDSSEEDYETYESDENEEPEDYGEEEISYRNFKQPQQPVKSQEKASQVTAEDIQAATAAITAAAAAITAAAAKAPASVPELDLPDLSGLGIPDVPTLNIPNVPDLPEVPGVPDLPGMSDLPDLSGISGVPNLPSNPFEADANADIPEVPTLSNDEPDYIDPLQSVMPSNPMGYQPGYPGYQQPVPPPVYGNQSMYAQPQSSVYLQPQQPMYAQPHTPAPAVHTVPPSYGNSPVGSVQFQQIQQQQPAPHQPQQPVSQGVRVSTIGQKTVVPDAVRNAIAKTAAQSNENIFDQQGKKVNIATDITSALNQMGEDTSSYNKPKQEDNEPVVQGYKEWRPKEDKKLANFKKGLNKKF